MEIYTQCVPESQQRAVLRTMAMLDERVKSSELNWNIVEHNRKIRTCKLLSNGGATRDRTDDLIVANIVNLTLKSAPLSC